MHAWTRTNTCMHIDTQLYTRICSRTVAIIFKFYIPPITHACLAIDFVTSFVMVQSFSMRLSKSDGYTTTKLTMIS